MKYLVLILVITSIFSCKGTIEKSWTVKDFSKPHRFKVETVKNSSAVNATIYLTGNFSDTIYLSRIKNDSTMEYTQKTLPTRILSDFYGGTFDFYLAPSGAKGELNVRIVINQYY